MKRVAVLLLLLAASACGPQRALQAPSPTPLPGEPGVARLIEDDPETDDPGAVPGSGLEYGRYAPGSR